MKKVPHSFFTLRPAHLQPGLIQWDIVNNKIPEFEINMTGGSDWKGFKAIFALGVSHIAEGLDHLLFLLVLLLSALQFPRDGFLQGVRPTKAILIKVGKIVTAFTLGHSLTLALGTFGWVNFPQRPIEVPIALSISITAFHTGPCGNSIANPINTKTVTPTECEGSRACPLLK
ncbi:HupE/UreJ family protein [Marinilongibacter aquaticus]|uniref:HupE/UreJ family protein n=1 Tax=Marinilongibacter aquaticus TaxID=2975157 RepID=UPI0021BDC9D7|nr:HupE/UreJ family protein [Marinilongibacter aquaticus]UBM58742.1 HupE/UreJ family protein [Marinilongibacter aquaticus]